MYVKANQNTRLLGEGSTVAASQGDWGPVSNHVKKDNTVLRGQHHELSYSVNMRNITADPTILMLLLTKPTSFLDQQPQLNRGYISSLGLMA